MIETTTHLGTTATEIPGKVQSELQRPAPDCFIAHVDASLGEQVLNVAEAQCEPEIKPYGMANEVGRKAVSTIGNRFHRPNLPA